LPDPESFGIQVDRRTLGEIVSRASEHAWLLEALRFRTQPSLLGKVTNYLKSLAYRENNLLGHNVNLVADLHDLIIDAAKSGYTFDQDQWQGFLRHHDLPKTLKKPLYTQYTEPDTDKQKVLQKLQRSRHVLDRIVAQVIAPRVEKFHADLKDTLITSNATQDHDLTRLWKQRRSETIDVTCRKVLQELMADLASLSEAWDIAFNPEAKSDPGRFKKTVKEYQARFKQILPSTSSSSHAVVIEWLRTDTHHSFSTWQKLRASALFQERVSRKGHRGTKFAFLMAWNELRQIKAESMAGWTMMCKEMHLVMRPSKVRHVYSRGSTRWQDASDELELEDLAGEVGNDDV